MSQKTKKAFAVPHTYTIIFALMVLVAALTWVVPSGVFDTAEVNGREVTVALGFNTAAEIFYEDEFRTLGAKVFVSTADGSKGTKGFVTDAIRENAVEFDYFYACGPMPMLRALCECCEQNGELSFEERMGCGFGACMGCSCKTLAGNKRICKDGPVMKREEIIW